MENRVSFQDYAIVACGTLDMELNYLKDSGFLDASKILYTKPGHHEVPRELESQLIRQIGTYLEGYSGKAQACIVIGYRFDDITIRDFFIRSLERGIRLILLNPEAEKIKKDKFAQFDENVVCVPKMIEDGIEDLKETLAPSEATATEPEADNPPVSE